MNQFSLELLHVSSTLSAIVGKRGTIMPKNIQLARRVRRKRA